VVATLAVFSSGLMLAVALMTEGGFAGNLRYVAQPAAMVCVLAGVGFVGLFQILHRRLTLFGALALALAALALAAPSVRRQVDSLDRSLQRIEYESAVYGADLVEVIAEAGGPDAVKACAPVFTGAFQTQAVAWYLDLHETEVSVFPFPPGTMIAPHWTANARDARFPVVVRAKRWMIGSTCRSR
jgi:hypothetical protein